MDATTFLEEVYRLHGGLVERQADRLVALAPPASGLPESAEVWAGTPDACPEGLEILHPGHPLLEAGIQRALQGGRFGLRHLVTGASHRKGLADLARRTFGFRNARLELGEGLASVVPWATFHFHVTFLWDEKREDLVSIPLDLHTGGRVSLASLEKAWLDPGGLPGADRGGLSAGLDFARRHLRGELAPRIQAMQNQARNHLEVEEARLASYYGGLMEDLARRLGSASPQRRAGLEAKRLQAEADWAARRAEMQDKFRLRVRAELACLEVVDLPRILMPARLVAGKSVRELVLSYNLLTREFDPLACEGCLGSTHVVWLCESGHLSCAKCHSTCLGCDRPLCRVCSTEGCARCGAGRCPGCGDCSAGCDQRAPAVPLTSRESGASSKVDGRGSPPAAPGPASPSASASLAGKAPPSPAAGPAGRTSPPAAVRGAGRALQPASGRPAPGTVPLERDSDLVRELFSDLVQVYIDLEELLGPILSLVEQRRLKAAAGRLAQLEWTLQTNPQELVDRLHRVGSCLRSSDPSQASSRLRKLRDRLAAEGVLRQHGMLPPAPRPPSGAAAARPPARASVPPDRPRPPAPARPASQGAAARSSRHTLEAAQRLLREVMPGCGAPEDWVERAVALLEQEAELIGQSNSGPAGWAAAVTYLTTRGPTQAAVGSWFGVSASTVSQRCGDLKFAVARRM